VVLTNPLGLHLRSSEKVVRTAKCFRSVIVIIHKEARANAKSLLDLATLAAECGTTLDIEAHGPDAEEAAAALAELFVAELDDAGCGGESAG
jgi:phosphocarrier protein